MKQTILILSIVITCLACEQKQQQEEVQEPFAYSENVKFNHLFFVIDDSTYKYLFDSIPFFREFAYIREADVQAGEDAWSGKYVSGNQDYLEIFRPGGAEGIELGDFGIAFMPNKLGIIDSLEAYLNTGADSIQSAIQEMTIGEGQNIPWFKAIAIHDPDSLAVNPWIMEHTPSFMQMAGFSEEELAGEISYADYTQRSVSTRNGIPYDSASYQRLYEKVTSIKLQLSQAEYNHFSKYLNALGFDEMENAFVRADLNISYQLTESEHIILNQIDFELREEVEKQSYAVGSVTFNAEGREAQLIVK